MSKKLKSPKNYHLLPEKRTFMKQKNYQKSLTALPR